MAIQMHPDATAVGGISEVRTMVMRPFSASQGNNSDTLDDVGPERMVSVGRMLCSPSNNATKIQSSREYDSVLAPPQD